MKKRLVLTAIALSCVLSLLGAQTKRVAVLPFEGDGLSAADVRALTLFFETALQNTKLCEIVEQTKVDEILKAHQFALEDFNDPAKAVAIGRLVPANTIALGMAGKLGSKPYVNIKLIDLGTGTLIAARNATAASVDALAEEMNALAAGMLGASSRGFPAPAASPPPASRAARAPPQPTRFNLALFESGPGIPPLGSRTYAVTFFSAATRFINWELFLEFAAPVEHTDEYTLEAIFRGSDGSIHAAQTITARIQTGWTWFRIENGWGAPNVYNWAPGTYTLNILLEGTLVGVTTFVVR